MPAFQITLRTCLRVIFGVLSYAFVAITCHIITTSTAFKDSLEKSFGAEFVRDFSAFVWGFYFWFCTFAVLGLLQYVVKHLQRSIEDMDAIGGDKFRRLKLFLIKLIKYISTCVGPVISLELSKHCHDKLGLIIAGLTIAFVTCVLLSLDNEEDFGVIDTITAVFLTNIASDPKRKVSEWIVYACLLGLRILLVPFFQEIYKCANNGPNEDDNANQQSIPLKTIKVGETSSSVERRAAKKKQGRNAATILHGVQVCADCLQDLEVLKKKLSNCSDLLQSCLRNEGSN